MRCLCIRAAVFAPVRPLHIAPKTREISGQARAQAMAVVEEGVHEVLADSDKNEAALAITRGEDFVHVDCPGESADCGAGVDIPAAEEPDELLVGTALAGVTRCSSAQVHVENQMQTGVRRTGWQCEPQRIPTVPIPRGREAVGAVR